MKKPTEIKFMADPANKILYITKSLKKNLQNLSSEDAKVYFSLKNMFYDYKDVVVPTLGTINHDEIDPLDLITF